MSYVFAESGYDIVAFLKLIVYGGKLAVKVK
jgi:hypothetical protein